MVQSARKHVHGFTLVEMLVYVAVTTVILAVLAPALKQGMDLSRIARATVWGVGTAEVTLCAVGQDIREAASVTVPARDAPAAFPEGARLMVRFHDGTGAMYLVRDHTLLRYRLPERLPPRVDDAFLDSCAKRAFGADFRQVRFSPLGAGNRLYRADLEIELSGLRAIRRVEREPSASFTTAFCMRTEQRR